MNINSSLESFNFINYLKIVDLSLLNLFDYIDINESNNVFELNDKLFLNFNANCKKLLEGFVINNINNETYYGKNNILINTCSPLKNWRSIENGKNKVNKTKIYLSDNSISIDETKLNVFIDSLFKRLPNLNAVLNKKTKFQSTIIKTSVSIQKKIEFIEFEDIDQYDAYYILDKILSSFGTVNKSGFRYNIIEDSNLVFPHSEDICEELFNEVQRELIKKEII